MPRDRPLLAAVAATRRPTVSYHSRLVDSRATTAAAVQAQAPPVSHNTRSEARGRGRGAERRPASGPRRSRPRRLPPWPARSGRGPPRSGTAGCSRSCGRPCRTGPTPVRTGRTREPARTARRAAPRAGRGPPPRPAVVASHAPVTARSTSSVPAARPTRPRASATVAATSAPAPTTAAGEAGRGQLGAGPAGGGAGQVHPGPGAPEQVERQPAEPDGDERPDEARRHTGAPARAPGRRQARGQGAEPLTGPEPRRPPGDTARRGGGGVGHEEPTQRPRITAVLVRQRPPREGQQRRGRRDGHQAGGVSGPVVDARPVRRGRTRVTPPASVPNGSSQAITFPAAAHAAGRPIHHTTSTALGARLAAEASGSEEGGGHDEAQRAQSEHPPGDAGGAPVRDRRRGGRCLRARRGGVAVAARGRRCPAGPPRSRSVRPPPRSGPKPGGHDEHHRGRAVGHQPRRCVEGLRPAGVGEHGRRC